MAINGTPNDDILRGTTGDDELYGGAGNDTLYGGGGGNDTLYGGAGDDTLNGGVGGNDTLSGGAGNDTFVLGTLVPQGFLVVFHGFGRDTIADFDLDEDTLDLSVLRQAFPDFKMPLAVQQGADTVVDFGDKGHLTLKNVDAAQVNALLNDDALIGTTGNDTLNGTTGDDTLLGRAGNDTLYGGGGGNDTLYGGAGDDTLDGGVEGNDTLTGGAGNDTFVFGAIVHYGFQVLFHGFGRDTITDFDPDEDTLDLSVLREVLPDSEMPLAVQQGADTVVDFGDKGHLTLKNVDAAQVNALLNDDALIGTTGNDTLNGTTGDDTLLGRAGDDTLTGGAGNDTLTGGEGNDTFVFRPGFGRDVITDFNPDEDALDLGDLEYELYGDDFYQSGADAVLDFGDLGHLTLKNTDAGRINELMTGSDLNGSDGNDTLRGKAGVDFISGKAGDDTIYGGAGHDFLEGGDGNDTIYGGAGDDGIHGNAGNDTLHGDLGNDSIMAGTGDDTVYGGAGDDTLGGQAGVDVLYGGAGADILHGGGDDDTLTGGAGADLFSYKLEPAFGRDTIKDFTDGEDQIDLRHSGVSGFDAVSATQEGSNVEIALSSQNGRGTIVLEDFNLSDLDASDFVF